MKTLNISISIFISFLFSAFVSSQSLMDNFKKHVSTLASEEFEGRAPMTKGDTLAINYIRDNFNALDGVELLGNNGLQELGFGGLREIIADSTSLKVGGKQMTISKDYLPSLYSSSGAFEGVPVYIGNGEAADYENRDLENKVIIIDGDLKEGESLNDMLFRKGALAEKAKVAGVVMMVSKFPTEETSWALSRRLRFVYVSPNVGKKLSSGANMDYQAKIENGLEKQTKTNNIVARIAALPANNPNKECIVIGAHYDHMGISVRDTVVEKRLGADDNASGSATLMELARYFSENRNLLKRDIVLISFAAEERGLRGSQHFVNNPLVPFESIKAMFNFDMTGRMEKNQLNVRGVGVVNEAFSHLSTLSNPDKLNLLLIMSGQEGTDYASFNRKGIPSVSFSTGIHKDYHSPRDTEDKINYEGMVKVYNFVLPFISRFATERSEFNMKD